MGRRQETKASRATLFIAAAALACVHCGDDGTSEGGGGSPASSTGNDMCGAQSQTRTPGLVFDDPSVGAREWVSPDAIVDGGETQVPNMLAQEVSHLLVGKYFNFDLPPTAVVSGVEVEWRRRGILEAGLADSQVILVKGGVPGVASRGKQESWGAYEDVLYGAPTDLWGESWTPADINGDSFGPGLSVVNTAEGVNPTEGVDTPFVEAVSVTVHFTVAC